jgi:preprotein translocase subunit SecE
MAGIVSYIEESYNELLNKVTWPSFGELQSSAVLVFVASLIIALLIFFMDFIFGVNQEMFWDGVLGVIYGMFNN